MRQLVLENPPDRKGNALLEGGEYRYLVQVLRKSEGDEIGVRLPDGTLLAMVVTAINRKEKTVSLAPLRTGPGPAEPEAGVSMPPIAAVPEEFSRIILFQWILKGPKMDQVIRQATETGVSIIVPVAGARCLSRDADSVGDGKTHRWDRIVREARQQSGSPVDTLILPPVPVNGIPEVWNRFSGEQKRVALVLSEAPLARKSLHEYLVGGPEATALAIGPEGGMTAAEFEFLVETGFSPVHFRTNILRAETAALYGIAAVQSALTESKTWQLNE